MKLQEMYDATPRHCKPRCLCCVHKAWRSICLCIYTYVNINNIYPTTYIYKLSSYDTHACCTDFTTYISGFLGKSSFLYSSLIYFLDKHLKYPVFLYWTILHEKRKWVLLIDTPRDHNSWPRDKVSCELCTNSSDIRLYLKKFLKIPN